MQLADGASPEGNSMFNDNNNVTLKESKSK
jgi:hypothetical protein